MAWLRARQAVHVGRRLAVVVITSTMATLAASALKLKLQLRFFFLPRKLGNTWKSWLMCMGTLQVTAVKVIVEHKLSLGAA